MAIKCRIWWDIGSDAYVVSSSFNEKLVEGLKHVIPSSDRWYDRATKFWYLKEPYGETLRKVAETIFGIGCVSFQSKTVAQQAQTNQSYIPPPVHASLAQGDAAILQFVKLLPYEAMRDSYRKAATILHPDKGGDPVRMSELNQLWGQIERDVYKK